jgi:TctA family transporter
MLLILRYLMFMIIGCIIAYGSGLLVEYEWGKQAGLIVFLCLYTASLYGTWILAVWMTGPKRVPKALTTLHDPVGC